MGRKPGLVPQKAHFYQRQCQIILPAQALFQDIGLLDIGIDYGHIEAAFFQLFCRLIARFCLFPDQKNTLAAAVTITFAMASGISTFQPSRMSWS